MNQQNPGTSMVQAVQQTMKAYKGELVSTLPSHLQEKGAGWMSSALASIRRNPQLLQAAAESPHTLINALSEAAQKGLQPGTEEYYLTPRKNKGKNEILGITGYQGEIELMYRAGAVSSVIVETVHANDKFDYVPGRDTKPLHEIDWMGERGELKLSYAYAIMKDGAVSKVVIVNGDRIKRAKSSSQGSDSKFSPWMNDPVAMWMKTAAHDLAKWVPTSSEYVREQLRAVRDVAAEEPNSLPAPAQETQPAPQATDAETFPNNPDEYIEGELVDSDGVIQNQEA